MDYVLNMIITNVKKRLDTCKEGTEVYEELSGVIADMDKVRKLYKEKCVVEGEVC